MFIKESLCHIMTYFRDMMHIDFMNAPNAYFDIDINQDVDQETEKVNQVQDTKSPALTGGTKP